MAARQQGDLTVRRLAPLLLAIACLAPAVAARAEDPIQFFGRLLGPPARTLERALAPERARPHAQRKAATEAKPRTENAALPGIADVAKPADTARQADAAKPADAAKLADTAKPEQPATTDLLSVPMPRLRPGDAGGPALGYAPATGIEAAPLAPEAKAAPPPVVTPLKLPPPAARSTCGAVIADLGVEATPLPSVVDGACVIPAPVSVSALDGGAVAFTTKALLNCSLAETLAAWMKNTVQPLAMKTLGHQVTGLRIAASYACRNRDNLADAKLSEHARGNAIDISAFKVEGVGWIDVEHGWTGGGDKADFLRKVRISACGPFTTVLGPGTDSYHTSHFHLDRAKRRTAGPSKGLYCK